MGRSLVGAGPGSRRAGRHECRGMGQGRHAGRGEGEIMEQWNPVTGRMGCGTVVLLLAGLLILFLMIAGSQI